VPAERHAVKTGCAEKQRGGDAAGVTGNMDAASREADEETHDTA